MRVIFTRLKFDVVGGDFHHLKAGWTHLLEMVPDRAPPTEAFALAKTMGLESIYILADKRYQANAMCDELIIQARCVLGYLNHLDGHRWYLTDYDASECICNG